MTMFTSDIVNLLYKLLTEKSKFCVVCFRTENERKLDKADKYFMFLKSIGQGRSWVYSKAKNSYICTFCCRLVERALLLLSSIKTTSRFINIMDLLTGESSLVSSLELFDAMLGVTPPKTKSFHYDRFQHLAYCNSELSKLQNQTSLDPVTLQSVDVYSTNIPEPEEESIVSFEDSKSEVIIENDIQIKCEDAAIVIDDDSNSVPTECKNLPEVTIKRINTVHPPLPDTHPGAAPATEVNQPVLDSSLLHPIIVLNNKAYVPSLNYKMVDGKLIGMTDKELEEFMNECIKNKIQLPKVILDTNNTIINQLKSNKNDEYLKILKQTIPKAIDTNTNSENENIHSQPGFEGPKAVLPVAPTINSDTSREEVIDTSEIALNSTPKPNVDWESEIPMEVITYTGNSTFTKSMRTLKRKSSKGIWFYENRRVHKHNLDAKNDNVIHIDD